jgi:hypothetical protein
MKSTPIFFLDKICIWWCGLQRHVAVARKISRLLIQARSTDIFLCGDSPKQEEFRTRSILVGTWNDSFMIKTKKKVNHLLTKRNLTKPFD